MLERYPKIEDSFKMSDLHVRLEHVQLWNVLSDRLQNGAINVFLLSFDFSYIEAFVKWEFLMGLSPCTKKDTHSPPTHPHSYRHSKALYRLLLN